MATIVWTIPGLPEPDHIRFHRLYQIVEAAVGRGKIVSTLW